MVLVARSTANGGAGTTSDAASGRGDFTFEIRWCRVCRHGIADDQAGYCGSHECFSCEMDTIELPFDSESVAIFELYKSQQHSPKSRIERQRSTSQAIV